MTIRLVTWNLQGRERPDLDAVVGVLDDLGPDVVVLQEVQRRQARGIAAGFGWVFEWRFKHWPLVIPAEGMAIVTPRPLRGLERRTLARRWRFWSSERRIALAWTIEPEGLRLVGTHLGAGVGEVERRRQALQTVAMASGPCGLVAGDLNTHPGSDVLAAFAEAGFADAWDIVRPDDEGATNWRTGPRSAPPVQRLDYVLTSGSVVVEGAWLPSAGDHQRFGLLSDHVPLVVDLSVDRG